MRGEVTGVSMRLGRSWVLVQHSEGTLHALHQLPERLALVEGKLDDRADVLRAQWQLRPLVPLLEDLGDRHEVERHVVLEHEQVEVEGDERLLARVPLLRQRQSTLHGGGGKDAVALLPQRVQDDDALLYPVHVEVVDARHLVVEQLREAGEELICRRRPRVPRGQRLPDRPLEVLVLQHVVSPLWHPSGDTGLEKLSELHGAP
mmetsp:Transcript_28032/g.67915  ORF Transcript_28032/g.67915 Transcript_28032/m.67915 type:complete len:204 (-) Transcript_28032:46-657(-)